MSWEQIVVYGVGGFKNMTSNRINELESKETEEACPQRRRRKDK